MHPAPHFDVSCVLLAARLSSCFFGQAHQGRFIWWQGGVLDRCFGSLQARVDVRGGCFGCVQPDGLVLTFVAHGAEQIFQRREPVFRRPVGDRVSSCWRRPSAVRRSFVQVPLIYLRPVRWCCGSSPRTRMLGRHSRFAILDRVRRQAVHSGLPVCRGRSDRGV